VCVCVCVGATAWTITDELTATHLATLQQLNPRRQYEIKVAAKSSASEDDITSVTKLISFGRSREPGNKHTQAHTHAYTHICTHAYASIMPS